MKEFLSLILFFSASCFAIGQENSPRVELNSNQIIYVTASAEETSKATVTCYSRRDSGSPWIKEIGPSPARIGRDGIALPNDNEMELPFLMIKKRETARLLPGSGRLGMLSVPLQRLLLKQEAHIVS